MKPKETSCGAVLYTMRDGAPLYCIVKTTGGHISFPKGHMNPGETEQQTATREINEETGMDIRDFLPGFREVFSYTSKKGHPKDAIFFLADYGTQRIHPQEEEITAFWEAPFAQALELINTAREQDILRKADSYLAASCEV